MPQTPCAEPQIFFFAGFPSSEIGLRLFNELGMGFKLHPGAHSRRAHWWRAGHHSSTVQCRWHSGNGVAVLGSHWRMKFASRES